MYRTAESIKDAQAMLAAIEMLKPEVLDIAVIGYWEDERGETCFASSALVVSAESLRCARSWLRVTCGGESFKVRMAETDNWERLNCDATPRVSFRARF